MPTAPPTVAVTGATGTVGGMVADRLAARGIHQRLVVRDGSRAPDLPRAEVATIAGYHDLTAMRSAFDGIDVVFLVSGEEAADRLEQHRTAVAAAAEVGVRRVVYTSFLGAAADATFTLARDHFHTERAIEAAGMGLTALRNSLYQDVLPHFVTNGVIRGPAGDGHFAPVARTDIADVAVACLVEASHLDERLDVTGPERLTMTDVARSLGTALGQHVRYEAESLDEAYASRARYGAPGWAVEAWVTSYAAIATGELDVVSDVVDRVTGHPPRSFEELLRAA